MSETFFRKYRPKTFAAIVGQETAARLLRNSVRRSSVGQAYLFSGPRGTGKTSAARIFARAINCSNPDDGEPCNQCEACLRLSSANDGVVLEIDAASHNSVEDVRELLQLVRLPPAGLRYRVFILDEAHMLSSSAWNALLKTLEEPPPHVVFLLATTEGHRVPATILSRCRRVEFRPLPTSTIVAHLRAIADREGVAISDEALHLLAAHADGGLRDGLVLLEQLVALADGQVDGDLVRRHLGIPPAEAIDAYLDAVVAGDPRRALTAVAALRDHGVDDRALVQSCLERLRDRYYAATDPAIARALLRVARQIVLTAALSSPTVSPAFALEAVVSDPGTEGRSSATSCSPPRPPSPARPAPAASFSPPAMALSLDAVRARWGKLCSLVAQRRPDAVPVLTNVRIVGVDGSTVLVRATRRHAEWLRDEHNVHAVASLSAPLFGVPIRIAVTDESSPDDRASGAIPLDPRDASLVQRLETFFAARMAQVVMPHATA